MESEDCEAGKRVVMGCCVFTKKKKEVKPPDTRPNEGPDMKTVRKALQEMKKTDAVPALALDSNPLHLKRIHQTEASAGSFSPRSLLKP